ncbi:hypothetical protein [Alkaliphilus hydrothermalis]|uniref:Large polyvalent-protein-associated domain-containing protein n=1 Tax=Alkaliphilus hydrothermalis TaxID=1482730 RepID=A0ABS2NTJ1_9FIRM|nr:hypothetical protein [Alkaliphilus hydrothermalis]MBM7616226.1 hypothetical protein [Alkaliphilus hydrothermalis]
MKLPELVEEIQQDLEAGSHSFVIYQVGRQWKYELYDNTNIESIEASEKKFFYIKNNVDDTAILVNGKRDFDDFDLKYLQNQIKKMKAKKRY